MDYPAVEPLEQPLGAADRGVERHMLAGGVAVEGDVHVVDPGAGHHDSFCDRTPRLTSRPARWPGSSLALNHIRWPNPTVNGSAPVFREAVILASFSIRCLDVTSSGTGLSRSCHR